MVHCTFPQIRYTICSGTTVSEHSQHTHRHVDSQRPASRFRPKHSHAFAIIARLAMIVIWKHIFLQCRMSAYVLTSVSAQRYANYVPSWRELRSSSTSHQPLARVRGSIFYTHARNSKFSENTRARTRFAPHVRECQVAARNRIYLYNNITNIRKHTHLHLYRYSCVFVCLPSINAPKRNEVCEEN